MRGNLIYSFDKRKTVRPRYMSRNTRSSRWHREHDKNSMSKRGSLLAKDKWDKNLLVILLKQGGKTCKSTHFLLCNYWAAELA